MKRFAYLYFMTDDPEQARTVGPRHTEYWHSLDLSGYSGGPFADRSGGLITFDVDETGQAEEAVANDPFVREGLIGRSWLRQWDLIGP